jgi:osmotically-inducible protein OsmY
MQNDLLKKKFVDIWIPGVLSLLMMAGVLAFLMITGLLFAMDMDEQIAASAKKTYVFRTYLKGDDIQVLAQDGVATLTGTVASEAHSWLAAETVADLPGVKRVDNRLEVLEGIPEKNSDAWLRMRVENVLRLHRSLDSVQAMVDVRDGRVTLRGEAGSPAAKELAAEYVKDIEGVQDVRNQMSVAKKPKAKEKTVAEMIDDASVKAQIKLALLFQRGTDPFRVNIAVDRGAVIVTGLARNAAEKELVGKRIADIHGVVSVDNRMLIE